MAKQRTKYKYPLYVKKNIDDDYMLKISKEDRDYMHRFNMEYYNGSYTQDYKNSIYFNEKFINLHRNDPKMIKLFEEYNNKNDNPTFEEFIVNYYQKKGSSYKRLSDRCDYSQYLKDIDFINFCKKEYDKSDKNIETFEDFVDRNIKILNKNFKDNKININLNSNFNDTYVENSILENDLDDETDEFMTYYKNKQIDTYIVKKTRELIDDLSCLNNKNKSMLIDEIDDHLRTLKYKTEVFTYIYKMLLTMTKMNLNSDQKRQLQVLLNIYENIVFKNIIKKTLEV